MKSKEIEYKLHKSFIYEKEDLSDDLKRKHESIKTILIENGNVEYGDCIIDEICEVVGIPTTNVYYIEGE